jgi:energy-coupling factor transporter ATP-binding protein EcfA2
MPLQSFEVQRFQSYDAPQRIELHRHLTFVAGENDVGKSGLLRAMRIPVQEQRGAREGFQISYAWELPAGELVSDLGASPETERFRQWITSSETRHVVLTERAGAGDVSVQQLRPARIGLPELDTFVDFTEGNAVWRGGEHHDGTEGIASVLRGARAAARRIAFITPRRIDLDPRSVSTQTTLAPDARNLTDVLFTAKSNDPTGVFEQLVEFMRGAFPRIRTVTVQMREGTPVMGEPTVIYEGGRTVTLAQCGSGVEQLLALGLLVLTASEPRLILVDEPQAYLHPHAERSLMRLIDQHREHQFVVATHSHQLLRARPLAQARLVTNDGEASYIGAISDDATLLQQFEITAADLWLADRVLWVEGISEVAIFDALLDAEFEPADRIGLEIRPMPGDTSRFASRTARQAGQAYEFCREVIAAISPVAIPTYFLFDRDEKDDEVVARLGAASDGRALFLPAREVENLFLDVGVIGVALNQRLESLEQPLVDQADIDAAFRTLLEQTDDRNLFPRGCRDVDDQLSVVKGSELLRRLYWEYTVSEYDKARDGRVLATLTLQRRPEALEPLRDALRRFEDAGAGPSA